MDTYLGLLIPQHIVAPTTYRGILRRATPAGIRVRAECESVGGRGAFSGVKHIAGVPKGNHGKPEDADDKDPVDPFEPIGQQQETDGSGEKVTPTGELQRVSGAVEPAASVFGHIL